MLIGFSYMQVWRDLKSRVSVKIRERKKEMARTGNKPLTTGSLTDLERRVVGLLGETYVEGDKTCVENIPEEEVSSTKYFEYLNFEKYSNNIFKRPIKTKTTYLET